MARIGFIGLGSMGRPMAARIQQAGHELIVNDLHRNAAAELERNGATWRATPREIADGADLVLVSLPLPSVVNRVALGEDGIVHGARAKLYVDLSTTGPRTAAAVDRGLGTAGIRVIDCPVSGGTAGARDGTLTLMVAGQSSAVAEAAPVLECLGRIFQVGERVGQGQTMKVLNNLLAATSLASTAEVLALGAKAGLEPAGMLDIVNAGTGRNFMTENWFRQAVADREFAAGMNCELMFKDVGLGLEVADVQQVPQWIGIAVRQLWSIAAARHPERDFMSIIDVAESFAGVSIRG